VLDPAAVAAGVVVVVVVVVVVKIVLMVLVVVLNDYKFPFTCLANLSVNFHCSLQFSLYRLRAVWHGFYS
jgi:hypothetical protein